MALTPRLVSGSSAKRPEPSEINAMPLVHKNSTGQPWTAPGDDEGLLARYQRVPRRASRQLLGPGGSRLSVERDSSAGFSSGLSEREAGARLKAEGPNTLPAADRRSFGRIILEVLREPMFALLLAAAVIYLILGDLTEAVVLAVFASTSVLIAVVQVTRTERMLESLRDLTSPRALVIRDGAEKRIAGAEVVRGDLIILAEGDRVAADATVVSAHELQCDESLLTGEAVPVRKIAASRAPAPGRPGGDDLPYVVYSGSLVVRGHSRAEVTATGARSEIGKIGLAITRIAPAAAAACRS